MNFLAHLALAGPDEASRIGNILGDFEKGTPEWLASRHSPAIVAGIMMHRHIDRATDDHPHFHLAKKLLAPTRRRFAGILIDLYFDHFLHRHWSRYHPGAVADFICEIHDLFERRATWLGESFGALAPSLQYQNWLAAYGSLEGLQLTLERIASRSPRFQPLCGGLTDFHDHEEALETHFLALYPDLRQLAARLLGNKTPSTPSFP